MTCGIEKSSIVSVNFCLGPGHGCQAASDAQMSAVETRQMSSVETGQMSAAETGQMSSVARTETCLVSTRTVEVSEISTAAMSQCSSLKGLNGSSRR